MTATTVDRPGSVGGPGAPGGLSTHPANLALRLALEVAALGALGWSAATAVDGPLGTVAAVAAPLAAAAAWVTFAVRGDPSRSGRAPVPVSGRMRMLVESAVLLPAVAAPALLGRPVPAAVFGAALLVHTALSRDRVLWLWRGGRATGPPSRTPRRGA